MYSIFRNQISKKQRNLHITQRANAVPEFDSAGNVPSGERAKEKRRVELRATSMERGSRRALGFFCGFAGRGGSLCTLPLVSRDFTSRAELGRVDGSGTFEFGPIWTNLRIARGGWPTKEGPIRTGFFRQSRQCVMDENGNFWFYVIFDLVTVSISKWDL